MTWLKDPKILLLVIGTTIVIITCVLLFSMRQKTIEPNPPVARHTGDNPVNDIEYTGETQMSDLTEDDNPEEFGMYDSALPSWLAHRPNIGSVDRYTKNNKQQIQNVSSINTAILPALSDYIPYDPEANRFQTPSHYLPNVNPVFNNHIRTEDKDGDDEVTSLLD